MTTRTEQEKTAQVLKQAGAMLRGMSAENEALRSQLADEQAKTAQYERRTRAEKVAAQMHQKGIHTDVAFPQLVGSLEKAASEGKLASIEEAVDMVGPDMSLKTAAINDNVYQSAGSDLERFLLG